MSTAMTATSGSKLKDLVVTAAVASVVSALVAPWIRRWMDGPAPMGPMQPGHPGMRPMVPARDDFNVRLEKLLDVPNPFGNAMAMPRVPGSENEGEDEEDEDGR